MQLLTRETLAAYLERDAIAARMDELSEPGDEALVCQRWLRDTPAKRLVFERLYGDLLGDGPRRRVLDVGGGLTCFTRAFAEWQDYELIDLMAHEDGGAVERCTAADARPAIHVVDWYEFEASGTYDLVVANDLFPNVDQRLTLFLERMLPIAREIRLSLTVCPQPRFYRTRRMDGEEVLFMLAWDGETTARALAPHLASIREADLGLLTRENASVYPNGRQVCLVTLEGDVARADCG